MENAYFLYPDSNDTIEIKKFHNCTWEFNNNSSLVEFGLEISGISLAGRNTVDLVLYIPWLTGSCAFKDLYPKLKEPANSKFIFNDFVNGSEYISQGDNTSGVIHKFASKDSLCLLPVTHVKNDKKLKLKVSLTNYNRLTGNKPNVYIRFSIAPTVTYISMRKHGISKSTIIYDIKLNERRNIPDDIRSELDTKELCKINQCFCFNILPNNYDVVFFDSSCLKNVRNLEYKNFANYIDDPRVKKDELMVIFNKKENSDAFSFFSIYAKERIGVAQISMAILLNVICSVLFFVASFRYPSKPGTQFFDAIWMLPKEIYIATAVLFLTLGYFVWPFIKRLPQYLKRKK